MSLFHIVVKLPFLQCLVENAEDTTFVGMIVLWGGCLLCYVAVSFFNFFKDFSMPKETAWKFISRQLSVYSHYLSLPNNITLFSSRNGLF